MLSSISKRRREGSRTKIKSIGDHKEFLKRITKTLYYGELPKLPCLSLPVTEISCSLWSEAQRGRSLRRLHGDAAADIARSACVSPCALVLAILYLERLNSCNPDYLANTAPAELFLISLMVGNKFLQDDGEDDEVICSEWAASGGLNLKQLNKLEVEFLSAIDWNVYVSEQSFEKKLAWLEREVALRQALLRGFFTYGDLTAASCLPHLLAFTDLLALAALAISYLSTLLPLLVSALLLQQTTTLPEKSIHSYTHPATDTSVTLDTNLHNNVLHNTSVPMIIYDTLYTYGDQEADEIKQKCCSDWLKVKDSYRSDWFDGVAYNWKLFETWWTKSTLLNWLYRSSLINPMQRWLEKINEYIDWKQDIPRFDTIARTEDCHSHSQHDPRHCLRRRLNLSKLSALIVSVSDR